MIEEEEEEEEEEIGNTQMDSESDIEMQEPMDEKPYGSTSAGSPANRGGLYDMSANELNGMKSSPVMEKMLVVLKKSL